MIKKFFTFWTVVLFLLLFFVVFCFNTFKDWGFFAQFLRVVIISLFIIRIILIALVIMNCRKELEKKKEERLADTILRRQKKYKEKEKELKRCSVH